MSLVADITAYFDHAYHWVAWELAPKDPARRFFVRRGNRFATVYWTGEAWSYFGAGEPVALDFEPISYGVAKALTAATPDEARAA